MDNIEKKYGEYGKKIIWRIWKKIKCCINMQTLYKYANIGTNQINFFIIISSLYLFKYMYLH